MEIKTNDYNELIKLLQTASDAYYNSGRTIMSDSEYDRLVERAKDLGYIESVGSEPVSKLLKIKHEHPMLSLDKVHTIEEIQTFNKGQEALAMYKMDGLTCSATYKDGILTRLETRGNGDIGNDIMIHAKSITNLPKVINKHGRYVIDGECIISYPDFESINNMIPDKDKYKNPRNLAAGSLNLLDPKISATRKLQFFVWDIIEGGDTNSLYENLKEAEGLGFTITPHNLCLNINQQILNSLRENAKVDGLPIDGVVIKYNDVSMREKLGYTGHHFLNAVAYKFDDEKYPSTLKDCIWQVGKTGQITPVLVFDPIEIDGTIVEKASAHNISVLKQLNPKIGCTCYVIKANSIIPQVDSCDEDGINEIKIPTICPICGSPTIITRENKSDVLMCTNSNCGGRLLGKFKHFVSRKGMDISGLSEQILQKFITLGWLHIFSDIYSLPEHYSQIINLDGFGKRSADNLVKALNESRQNVKLPNFITSLSIPGVGEGQSKLLCHKYTTWKEFVDARKSENSYISIEGIGEVIDSNIKQWFKEGDNLADANMLASMMTFEDLNKPEGDFPLLGKTFVITGKVVTFPNRDAFKAYVEELGGKVVGSVSAKTDFLINNDVNSQTGKNKKAKELGIPIISEEEFRQMVKK